LEQIDIFSIDKRDNSMNNIFFTIEQVSELLNTPVKEITNYLSENNKKFSKVENKANYRISIFELIELIENRNKNIKEEKKYKSNSVNKSAETNKNTKNCVLFYENKINRDDVINNLTNKEIECIEKNHEKRFIDSVFEGDNLDVLQFLLKEFKGKIDLIYIDPPFGTNKEFIAYDGKTGYSDKVTNSEFLEFLRIRLIILRELLSDKGSIYLHIDKKMGHYVKIILDEVFGEDNYVNEITRIKCNPKNFGRKAYGNCSDSIFFYAKERDNHIWNDVRIALEKHEIEELFSKSDNMGRKYTTHPLHAPGITKDGPTGGMWNGIYPPIGRHWRYVPEVLDELLNNNLIEWSETGNPRKIVYAKDHKGKKLQDVWIFKDKGSKYSTYPTEKNNDMLKIIIENSSNEGSIVLDCFAGSFSTLIQAGLLKRKFIGVDFSKEALEIGVENLKKAKIKYNYYRING